MNDRCEVIRVVSQGPLSPNSGLLGYNGSRICSRIKADTRGAATDYFLHSTLTMSKIIDLETSGIRLVDRLC
jgi:hypothetical protein